MFANADFEKVSMTAKLTAYMRQYSDIPYAKTVATAVQAEKAIALLQQDQSFSPEELLWYAPLFEVRYKSIASAIQKSGIKQVLELASGLSLRGLAMTQQDSELIYVETDLPDLTEQKTALLSHLVENQGVTRPAHHHMVAANALNLEELKPATQVLQRDQPVAVVNEGLLQYLSQVEMEQVTQNVCTVLRKFGGIWITPDFAIKSAGVAQTEAQRRFRQAIADETGRALYHDAFDTVADMKAFFERMGLTALRLNQVAEAPALASLSVLNDSTRPLWAQVEPLLNLWVIKLKVAE